MANFLRDRRRRFDRFIQDPAREAARMESRSRVRQSGSDNSAVVVQNGTTQVLAVSQSGWGNEVRHTRTDGGTMVRRDGVPTEFDNG